MREDLLTQTSRLSLLYSHAWRTTVVPLEAKCTYNLISVVIIMTWQSAS